MKIDVISENTLKITLSTLDMNELNVSCEELSAGADREILSRILRLAEQSRSFRFSADSEKLFVEAFPRYDGGCMLYISSLGTSRTARESRAPLPLVCRVDSLELLIRLCACLSGLCAGQKIKLESGAYTDGCRYCLAVRAESRFLPPVEHCMSEFGELRHDRLEYASVTEHFRPVCENNAISVLARLA